MKQFVAVVVFLLLFYGIKLLVEPYLVERYCQKLLSNPEGFDDELPARLLRATMKKGSVFPTLSLPIPSRDGEEIRIGTVAVNRFGVYIICQIHGDGLIENPSEAKWKYIKNGQCREFENPFHSQQGVRNLIEFYAKNANIAGVKAYSLVVYTDEALRFTHASNRSIINIKNLNRRLSASDKRGKLSRKQVGQLCKLFSDINKDSFVC